MGEGSLIHIVFSRQPRHGSRRIAVFGEWLPQARTHFIQGVIELVVQVQEHGFAPQFLKEYIGRNGDFLRQGLCLQRAEIRREV